MHIKNKNIDLFDDDFEITYEDDSFYHYEDSPDVVHSEAIEFEEISEKKPLQPNSGTKISSEFSIYKITQSIVRGISFALILGTGAYLAFYFWKGSAPYGDFSSILTEKNPTLIAFSSVPILLLLFEFFSFFWALTKVNQRHGRKFYKKDIGRGLFSFIFVYITSYISFWIYRIFPTDQEVFYGIRGALEVFGSMHNALFGICLAGVISCLVRKYMPL